MRKCPRCGASIKPFRALSVDITSRLAFALAVTLALLPADGLLATVSWYIFHPHAAGYLLVVPSGAAFRFAMAYGLIWSRAPHLPHHKPPDWKEVLFLSSMPAVLCFGPFCVWGAASILWPARQSGSLTAR